MLLQDELYVTKMKRNLRDWQLRSSDDKRLAWELLKYKIRKFTIEYRKDKSKTRNQHQHNLEQECVT